MNKGKNMIVTMMFPSAAVLITQNGIVPTVQILMLDCLIIRSV